MPQVQFESEPAQRGKPARAIGSLGLCAVHRLVAQKKWPSVPVWSLPVAGSTATAIRAAGTRSVLIWGDIIRVITCHIVELAQNIYDVYR
jgi:hypothetical protein